MSDQKPSRFLVIKEPPFPASYDEATYVARTLEEMSPSYRAADYKGRARLLVRQLPRSADELHELVLAEEPGADLPRTMIGSFGDTAGGRGVRVAIYKSARTIEADGDSIDEARRKLQARVPAGSRIKEERIVARPTETCLVGRGETQEAALAAAQSQAPPDARTTFTRSVTAPSRKTASVREADPASARQQAERIAGVDGGTIVTRVSLTHPGRAGFLGIGRRLGEYACEMLELARAEVVCTRGRAKLIGLLEDATSVETTKPSADLDARLVETTDVEKARQLLEQGANVNAKDRDGKTPLMNASYYGARAVVELLLERGANVGAQYVDGCTALMWAAGEGNAEIVSLLLRHGADPQAKERHGQTALMLARRMNRRQAAEVLEEWGRA